MGTGIALLSGVIAAALLIAGVGKLVDPAGLVASLSELTGGRQVPDFLVRAISVLEVGLGIAIPLSADVSAVRVAAVTLGMVFAGVGLIGRLRSTDLPCGCFGDAGEAAFGWRNVAFGLLLCLWAILTAPLSRQDPAMDEVALLFAMNVSVLALCWRRRAHVRSLFKIMLPGGRAV